MAHSIDGGAEDIQSALTDNVRETDLPLKLLGSIYENAVNHRNDGAEPKDDKHASAKRTPLRGAKFGLHRDGDADGSQQCDL